MTISQLVARLEAVKAEYGDLPVYKGIVEHFNPVTDVEASWVEGEDALVRVLEL